MYNAVIAKYAGHAGHVRQSSCDVWQRAQALPDILSGRVQYMEGKTRIASHQPVKMSGRGFKCPAEH